jgi:hypothetical protein
MKELPDEFKDLTDEEKQRLDAAVDKEGKTEVQVTEELKARYAIADSAAEEMIRKRARYMQQVADPRSGLPMAGHNPGRTVRIVWADDAAFDRWLTRLGTIPGVGDSAALAVTVAQYEFPDEFASPEDPEPTLPAHGRRYAKVKGLNRGQIAWLMAAADRLKGMSVVAPGTWSGELKFGADREPKKGVNP